MSDIKDKRISVNLGDEDAALAQDVETLAEKLRVPLGTLGFFAMKYVIPRVNSGELALVNGELIPMNPPAAKAVAKRKAA